MEFKVGNNAVTSYRRLSYKPWFAIAEFVDNSTQSYFNNREVLDQEFEKSGEKLEVAIVYEREDRLLRIADNAMGMNLDDLNKAMEVARVPDYSDGRSRYGMGMKTAAFWMGDKWQVRTKKLGEKYEYLVKVDLKKIIAGENSLEISRTDKDEAEHYTIIDVTEHNREFAGRTIGKIKEYLRSIYRADLRNEIVKLEWRGAELHWEDPALLHAKNGSEYKKEFDFRIGEKKVTGWVGILKNPGRARAGFSILKSNRVIKGWPDSWRPSTIYGQEGGSNDLINQRVVGEVNLDGFEVSHTKDDILWFGQDEDDVEKKLLEYAKDYREFAKVPKKDYDGESGPSEADMSAAIDELRRELESPSFIDKVGLTQVPPPDVIKATVEDLGASLKENEVEPAYSGKVGDLSVSVYLNSDSGHWDPYVAVEATDQSEVLVIVSTMHPHFRQISGPDGMLNYLKHCVYDAISESRARHKAGSIEPSTIKTFKDQLLRVRFEILNESQADSSRASENDDD